ncbi:unnamed protein product [Paramecium sonneborni]|uniref:Uncharacterized protein n=1 Tax=Paramecium sonneborni TaxID=65129 RepID=A0A8S1NJJ2_9CILI|nr:unnamed protein product [Paramecium sonneborni]
MNQDEGKAIQKKKHRQISILCNKMNAMLIYQKLWEDKKILHFLQLQHQKNNHHKQNCHLQEIFQTKSPIINQAQERRFLMMILLKIKQKQSLVVIRDIFRFSDWNKLFRLVLNQLISKFHNNFYNEFVMQYFLCKCKGWYQNFDSFVIFNSIL